MTISHDLADGPLLHIEALNHDGIAWIAIRGEADLASWPDLEAALSCAGLNGVRSAHLNLAGLTFADVGSLRRLAAFAGRVRQAGGYVDACGARPTVRKVTRMLGFHDLLGLS
jgi:anti-anti-sigma factor